MPYADPTQKKAYNTRYNREVWYPRHRAEHIRRVARITKVYIDRVRALVDEFKRQGCCRCRERAACCLDAHHPDPKVKEFSLFTIRYRRYALERVVAELAKCECVCRNCHAKIHAGLLPMSQVARRSHKAP